MSVMLNCERGALDKGCCSPPDYIPELALGAVDSSGNYIMFAGFRTCRMEGILPTGCPYPDRLHAGRTEAVSAVQHSYYTHRVQYSAYGCSVGRSDHGQTGGTLY